MSKIVTGVNDIFTLRPDLKEYWDFEKNELDPNKTGARSNRNAWWVCKKCGKSFEQSAFPFPTKKNKCEHI